MVCSQEAREEEEEPQQKAEALESQLLFHHGRQLLGEYLKWKELAGVPRDTESVGRYDTSCTVYAPHSPHLSHSFTEEHSVVCEDKQNGVIYRQATSWKGQPIEDCKLCGTMKNPFSKSWSAYTSFLSHIVAGAGFTKRCEFSKGALSIVQYQYPQYTVL